jgi:hypothetical protein
MLVPKDARPNNSFWRSRTRASTMKNVISSVRITSSATTGVANATVSSKLGCASTTSR